MSSGLKRIGKAIGIVVLIAALIFGGFVAYMLLGFVLIVRHGGG
jgi:hypothetical protein